MAGHSSRTPVASWLDSESKPNANLIRDVLKSKSTVSKRRRQTLFCESTQLTEWNRSQQLTDLSGAVAFVAELPSPRELDNLVKRFFPKRCRIRKPDLDQ